MPDIAELLPRAAQQLPLYAFSNTNRPHVDHFSKEYAGLLGHFRELYLSSSIGLRKPDVEAFDHVVAAIGVPANRIVFFDDLAENIEGARSRGLTTVHCDLAPRRRERPQGARNLISDRQADGPRMELFCPGARNQVPLCIFIQSSRNDCPSRDS